MISRHNNESFQRVGEVACGGSVGEGDGCWIQAPAACRRFSPVQQRWRDGASLSVLRYIRKHPPSPRPTWDGLTGRVDRGGSCHVSSMEKNNKTAAMEMTHNTAGVSPREAVETPRNVAREARPNSPTRVDAEEN